MEWMVMLSPLEWRTAGLIMQERARAAPSLRRKWRAPSFAFGLAHTSAHMSHSAEPSLSTSSRTQAQPSTTVRGHSHVSSIRLSICRQDQDLSLASRPNPCRRSNGPESPGSDIVAQVIGDQHDHLPFWVLGSPMIFFHRDWSRHLEVEEDFAAL